MCFYGFSRMLFGLCNARATFQRLMERCMGDLSLRDCLIHFDDVTISVLRHFSRLKGHNLKLKADLCKFIKSCVTGLRKNYGDISRKDRSQFKRQSRMSGPNFHLFGLREYCVITVDQQLGHGDCYSPARTNLL